MSANSIPPVCIQKWNSLLAPAVIELQKLAEVGCYLSHGKCQAMSANSIPPVCIQKWKLLLAPAVIEFQKLAEVGCDLSHGMSAFKNGRYFLYLMLLNYRSEQIGSKFQS